MKKLIYMCAISAAMMFGMNAAWAQESPTPDDTQARIGSNLVNQVSAANFKTVAEVPALQQNHATTAAAAFHARMLNLAADNYQAMSMIQSANMAALLRMLREQSPEYSIALSKSMDAGLAGQQSNLGAGLAGGQIFSKTAQSTPPVSVSGQVGQ